jgi:tRNA (cytidine/uridine-2'-O-)-methyltransferase
LNSPSADGIDARVSDEPRLHVVLYQPEIPHNTGAVGRTCVAAGAKLWLVRPLGFRVDDYHLRRAGLDYWEHLEFEVVDDWIALAASLPLMNAYFYSKKAQRSYTTVDYRTGDVLVFGNESSGLPLSLCENYRERLLKIPIRAEARSLNLSNSVAIVVFEALRQWST